MVTFDQATTSTRTPTSRMHLIIQHLPTPNLRATGPSDPTTTDEYAAIGPTRSSTSNYLYHASMNPTDNQNDGNEDLPDTEVHHTLVREELGVLLSIVEEMSAIRECSPFELEPLQHDVDPDKLNWVVEGADENKVSFHSNGIAVTVYGDGTLVLNPTDE